MAARDNYLQEMEESFSRFSIKEEEQGGISYEETTEELSDIDLR